MKTYLIDGDNKIKIMTKKSKKVSNSVRFENNINNDEKILLKAIHFITI